MEGIINLERIFPFIGLVATSLLGSAIILYMLKLKKRRDHWKKLGIKGITPVFGVLGEALKLFKNDSLESDHAKVVKYGKVFGAYAANVARIYVADPEVARQILVKDFDHFINHAGHSLPDKYQKLFLVYLKNNDWKRVRAIMTPTFTSGKIKRMFRFLDGCAEDFLDYLGEQAQEHGDGISVELNSKDAFTMYTMDGVATCCYGLKLRREESVKSSNGNHKLSQRVSSKNSSLSTREDLIRLCQEIFTRSSFRAMIVLITPRWLLKALGFTVNSEHIYDPLVGCVKQLLRQRVERGNSRKFDDLLQLLLDARIDDKVELDELDQAENHHANLSKDLILDEQERLVAAATPSKLHDHDNPESENSSITQVSRDKSKLSESEIIAGAMLLLAAGVDTSSITLALCSMTLANHPQVQDKLYEELKKIVELDANKEKHIFQYESITSCHYLDAVISETLRLFPPAPATERLCNQDYLIEKYNVPIPKNTQVMIYIRAIHRNPEYWEEPNKFNPDRFLPENRHKIVPGSYLPFSMGPRHCIGMRFSLTEAKLGLAKLIMKYQLRPAKNCAYPPTIAGLTLKKPTDSRVVFIKRVE